MARRGKKEALRVNRIVIEHTAQIMGPSSACAQALEKAATMKEPEFFAAGDAILVRDAASDPESP